MNKGVLAFLMAGVGIGIALTKALAAQPQPTPQLPHTPEGPRAAPAGHRLADRLSGYLEVERN